MPPTIQGGIGVEPSRAPRMNAASSVERRLLLRQALLLGGYIPAASLAGAWPAWARRSVAETVPTRPPSAPAPALADPAMIVAGPRDAATARWAEQLAGPLSAALDPNSRMRISAVGGRDGVTAANAFEALTNPDGSTALLVPGAAAMAWLAGDPRVHFDAGSWVPALARVGSAVMVGRTGPRPATLRVAASTPRGIELPALLGLSLLGTTPIPVFGLAEPDDARAALRRGEVDAILLTGRDVPARYAALCGTHSGSAAQAIFSFGGDMSASTRDPDLAGVPTLPELYRAATGRAPGGVLFDAWKATAAAARLDAALVLRPLAPAAQVAQWRMACNDAVTGDALAAAAHAARLDALPAPGCVAALAAVVADENTLLALRRWIAGRNEWRPA